MPDKLHNIYIIWTNSIQYHITNKPVNALTILLPHPTLHCPELSHIYSRSGQNDHKIVTHLKHHNGRDGYITTQVALWPFAPDGKLGLKNTISSITLVINYKCKISGIISNENYPAEISSENIQWKLSSRNIQWVRAATYLASLQVSQTAMHWTAGETCIYGPNLDWLNYWVWPSFEIRGPSYAENVLDGKAASHAAATLKSLTRGKHEACTHDESTHTSTAHAVRNTYWGLWSII